MTKNIKTRYINPANTKARKIASLGFGSKKDCKGYLQSTSLSPLNDKFFFALHDFVFTDKLNRFEFTGGDNALIAEVVKVTTHSVILAFELCNRSADKLATEYRNTLAGGELEEALARLPRYNHSFATVKIAYRRDFQGAEKPARYMGDIHRFEFDGEQYYKEDGNGFRTYTVTIL